MGERSHTNGAGKTSTKRRHYFLQLREKKLSEGEFIKEAREMKKLAAQYQIPFVINDNIKVALEVDADGVHIGQDDMSVEEARKLLGEDKIIGVSAHNVKEALKAQKGGADYLGVGAVCATSTKKDANVVSKEEIKRLKKLWIYQSWRSEELKKIILML